MCYVAEYFQWNGYILQFQAEEALFKCLNYIIIASITAILRFYKCRVDELQNII